MKNQSSNNNFQSTIYEVESLAKKEGNNRVFSIREYIITVGRDIDSSKNNALNVEWFSLYNTHEETRYEVYYKKSLEGLYLIELYKWSDQENISLLSKQINTDEGLRVLNEIKSTVKKVQELEKV